MANDSLLTLNPQMTPTISTSPTDSSGANNYLNQGLGAIGNQMGADLQKLDYSRMMAQRYDIMAQESQHQQDLALPMAMNKMQESTLDAVGKVTELNEAKRAADMQQQNVSWVTNQQISLETGFNDYLRQAKSNAAPDGSGFEQNVQGWLNNYEKTAFQSAPSNAALTEMYSRSSAFKIHAMQMAGNYEGMLRSKDRIDTANQSVNSMANQVFQDPSAVGSSLASVDSLQNSMKGDLQSPEQGEAFAQSAKASVYMSALKGAVSRNDFASVDKMYNDPGLQSTIPGKELDGFMMQAATKEQKFLKDQQKVAVGNMLNTAFDSNQLTKGMPGADAAATQNFNNFLTSKLGDTTQAKPQDISNISTGLLQYFNDHNSFASAKTLAMIGGKIKGSTNPNEAMGFALALNGMSKDPDNSTVNILNQVPADVRAKAYTMSSMFEATGDPQKAMDWTNQVEKGVINDPKQHDAELQLKAWAGTGKDAVMEQTTKAYNNLFNGGFLSGNGLSDQDKMNGALEMQKNMKDFISAGYKPDVALQLAGNEVKAGRSITQVNGYNEVMKGAPELYYQGSQLNQVNAILQSAVSQYKGTNPTDTRNVGIGSWDGITQFQSNAERWYMLKDLDTNRPITDKTGANVIVPVKTDQSLQNQMMQGAVDKLSKNFQSPLLGQFSAPGSITNKVQSAKSLASGTLPDFLESAALQLNPLAHYNANIKNALTGDN